MPARQMTVCFSGYRPEKLPWGYDECDPRCAQLKQRLRRLIVTIECWKDVHPALVTLPVDWDHPISYGILYAKEPDADVTHFIETVKKAQEKNM